MPIICSIQSCSKTGIRDFSSTNTIQSVTMGLFEPIRVNWKRSICHLAWTLHCPLGEGNGTGPAGARLGAVPLLQPLLSTAMTHLSKWLIDTQKSKKKNKIKFFLKSNFFFIILIAKLFKASKKMKAFDIGFT